MKLSSLRRTRVEDPAAVHGTARADRCTRQLARRLTPGDVAVIDHIDIDRAAAVALVDAGVVAVINAAPSVSGRYPNLGPQVLLNAGVALIDNVGADAFTEIGDGDALRVAGDTIYRSDAVVGCGVRQTATSVTAALEASKDGLASQLAAFSVTVIEHLRREKDLLFDGAGVPTLATPLRARHVLVVMRAFDYQADLAALKTYIKEVTPVLVGVDAGADVLLHAGYRPDIVVTIADDISDSALQCGAELVYVAPRDGSSSTSDRLERLGARPVDFPATSTPEDAALLLAAAADAAVIVVAGSHSTLLEFIDRGRSTMASAFLTRAAVGSRLIDAKAVAAIYRNRTRGWWVALLVLLSMALVAAAVATTPAGQDWANSVQVWILHVYRWFQDRLR